VFCVACFLWVVFSFCIVCILNLSSVLYFPACTDVNGTVQPKCADEPLRIYSLAHSLTPTNAMFQPQASPKW